MKTSHKRDDGKQDDPQPRKGTQAPDPQKSDLGRTDDVPRETAMKPSALSGVDFSFTRSRE